MSPGEGQNNCPYLRPLFYITLYSKMPPLVDDWLVGYVGGFLDKMTFDPTL